MHLEALAKWRRKSSVPSQSDIVALEQKYDIRFPDDYRQYLLVYNGGHFRGEVFFSFGGQNFHIASMYGIGTGVPSAELCRKQSMCLIDFNDPVEVVPIGGTEENDLILMDVSRTDENGMIILKTFDEAFEAFDSFTEFVENLKDRVATLGW